MDTHAPVAPRSAPPKTAAATAREPRDGAPSRGRSRPVVAVIVKGYPRLSETFIAQELLGLERRGLELRIWSLRQPYDPTTHPVHAEIAAPVAYLPEYLWRAPLRVWRSWRRARRLDGYATAWRAFLADLMRDRTPNRIRRFGQACVLAAELSDDVDGLYAHFLHTPASVARYTAAMRGLGFAVSAHAKDIWTTPDWEIAEKIADADWLTTCTAAGAARLRDCAAPVERSKVRLTYHGLDLARFPLPDTERPQRDGSDAADPTILISVGRLVAKKGYDDLLAALATLPVSLHWRLVHIGGGPLKAQLARQADRLGIAGRIDWLGRQAQTEVLARLRAADLFVLSSRIADDGDRDGLPNVLMEAQSQRLACVATNVSGIPELITDGATGRLVPSGDPAALADALAQMIADPATRTRLGDAGAERLRAAFSMDHGLDSIGADLIDSFSPADRAGIC